MSPQILTKFVLDRAQKTFGLVGGTPTYDSIDSFQAPEVPARTYQYSADGRLFAYAIPTGVRIFQAESAQLLQELTLPNVVEISFSPRGTYLSIWERPQKLEDGAQHKNLRVFSVSTGEELVAFTQKSLEGWELQYTISESHAIRLVNQEIQVFRPAEWSKGVVDKLKVEGATSITLSPGLNPSVAVFLAEKKVRWLTLLHTVFSFHSCGIVPLLRPLTAHDPLVSRLAFAWSLYSWRTRGGSWAYTRSALWHAYICCLWPSGPASSCAAASTGIFLDGSKDILRIPPSPRGPQAEMIFTGWLNCALMAACWTHGYADV